MFAIEHRVRVFVFQVLEDDVRYLLLRRRPHAEWPLGPAIGEVAVHEHIQDAVVREVKAETGIRSPHHMFEIAEPSKELFGGGGHDGAEATGLVEWPIAYQAGSPDAPVAAVRPGPEVDEYHWMAFGEAFQRLETSTDRDALVRLRLDLHG